MRIKKYIIPAVIIAFAISIIVSGTSPSESIDALTRSSEDTATSPLMGIKKIRLGCQVLRYGDKSIYENLPKFNWFEDTESEMEKSGLKIEQEEYADGLVLLDIDLAKSKEMEFVAVNLRLSFVEIFHLDRIPIKGSSEWRFNCTTYQSCKTMILHRNELNSEVQKHVQDMIGNFCRVCEASRYERLLKEHEK